jgi:DNA uptake protein ComE-like DNA-binding protein
MGKPDVEVAQPDDELTALRERLETRERELAAREEEIEGLDEALAARDEEVARLDEAVGARVEEIARLDEALAARAAELKQSNAELERLRKQLDAKDAEPPTPRPEPRVPPPLPERQVPAPPPKPEPSAPAPGPDTREWQAKVSLGRATFEDLRALGLSVTQSRRILRYRDDGRLGSLDDLDEVPGFPKALRAELRQRLIE